MIIVRVPLRIPIGGGGTDLPFYYSQFGGEWISAAIDKYVYVAVNKSFNKGFRIRYSKTEEVEKPEQIQHPIFREAIKLLNIDGGLEIVSVADVPTNTGLGSSGSFTVALLTALHAFLRSTPQDNLPTKKNIAEQACHIAINLLKEPSGKQDEYIAAYGGVNSFFASQAGDVTVEPFYPQKISTQTLEKLENNLLMFYTGIKRESNPVLKAQVNDVENFHRVKEIGREIKSALARSDLSRFGELLDIHWQEKIKRSGTSDPQINDWYQTAKTAGALGGKLMGAGGGGFFLFYCESQKEKLRKAMQERGLPEQSFHFDMEGAKVITDFK